MRELSILCDYAPMLRTAFLLSFLFPLALSAQEICNNGIDDDADGLVDLNDPDCPCSTVLMPPGLPSYIRNPSFEDRMCCPYGFVSIVSPPWLDCAAGWHQATSATSDYLHMCGYAPAGMPMPPPDGQGAVGFYAMTDYKEYVGTCLTYPLPSNPLLAGTTYTLSLWIACAGADGMHTQTEEQGSTSVFPDQFPLAIFGYANACVPFPIGTMNCIGDEPGWGELGRVMVQPAWDWVRVSITFTPTQDIHSVIIGSACDLPASFTTHAVVDSHGNTNYLSPYFLVDDLMLTIAQDQVLSPTAVTGNLCLDNAVATAQPPAGATGYQWYLDGVALAGQNSTTLGISAAGLGTGVYTMASTFNGECLMGAAFMPPPIVPRPLPFLQPTSGCAPLTVAFADTTGGGTTTVSWNLGDGTELNDGAFAHTYTAPGSYDVLLRVQNDAGCTGDTLLQDAVVVHPAVTGQISAAPNPTDTEHPDVAFTGTGTGGIVTWWWDLGAADPTTSADPSFTATFPAEPGSYPVMLVVTSAAGCVDTVRSVVVIVEPGVIEMPNVFSPNGDGRNDRFIPLNYNGTPGLLEVYNRWGQMIFSTR
ncbi:MAG: PKD domain-containing protein, partial [Bacteroidetes bacterium]|nr:PKD domain-containing protein [Bacteroidota bacterium]